VLALALSAPLAGCAHNPPPRAEESSSPSRDDVQATMQRLTPALAGCVPKDRKSIQVKLRLDGQAGVVERADLLPDTQVVCASDQQANCATEAPPEPLDLTVLQCVREASQGKPAPHFGASGFNLTFRVARPPEPKR
jgi:hypothetical protein